MTPEQLALLDKHSALILPEEISHDAYVLLVEAVLHITGYRRVSAHLPHDAIRCL